MKHNLMVVSNNYDLSKEIANNLAEYFSMRVFDEIELLNFDFSPRTINELQDDFGSEFVYKKLSKTLLSQCEFENIVFLTHYETINMSASYFEKLKEHDFIIMIRQNILQKENVNKQDKLFSNTISTEEFNELSKNLADFSVAINSNSIEEVSEIIIKGIKSFYGLE